MTTSFFSKLIQSTTRFLRDRSPFIFPEERRIQEQISQLQKITDAQDVQWEEYLRQNKLDSEKRAAELRAIRSESARNSWKHEYAMQRIETRRIKQEQERVERFWAGVKTNSRTAPFSFVEEKYGRDALYPFLQLIFGFERRWSEELLNASYSDDYSMRDRETKDVHREQTTVSALLESVGHTLEQADPGDFLTQARAFFSKQVPGVFSYIPPEENPVQWDLRLGGSRATLGISQEEWVNQSMSRLEKAMLEKHVHVASQPAPSFSGAL